MPPDAGRVPVNPGKFRGAEKLRFQKPDRLGLEIRFDPPGNVRGEDLPQEDGLPFSYRAAAQCCEDRIGLVFEHAQPGFFFRTLLTRSISFRAAERNVSSMPARSTICLYIVSAWSYLPIFSYDWPDM